MARIRFNHHNYETAFLAWMRWYWKQAQGVSETPEPLVIGHGEGCCDYWITDPDKVYRIARKAAVPLGHADVRACVGFRQKSGCACFNVWRYAILSP